MTFFFFFLPSVSKIMRRKWKVIEKPAYFLMVYYDCCNL